MQSPINRGARNQLASQGGQYYVAAELNRKGAYAVSFAGNMPAIDVLASNLDQSRIVTIQVKTKRTGTWHAKSDEGKPFKEPNTHESRFWIFVDIGDYEKYPEFWIVPEWWIKNDIYKTNQAFLKRHGGHRPSGSKSKHHGIDKKRITQWKGKWDILGIF